MNKKMKAKWLKALRSGKYKQGKGHLHSKAMNTYCCLGVLQEVCRLKKEPADELLLRHGAHGLSWDEQKELAHQNDNGLSFDVIADYIEDHL